MDVQLSGWAGDLQTLIYDIKVHANEENSNLNEVAKKYICSDESEYFKEDDMFSDIDADNIVYLYNQSELLSDVLKDYYNNVYKDRFKIFVDNYGGIEKLEEKADEFTHGDNPVKHYFMKDKAEEAAYTLEIRKQYEESFEGYKYYTSSDMFGNPLTYSVRIYSIPDPKIITQEESDALTYAFINYIKGKL